MSTRRLVASLVLVSLALASCSEPVGETVTEGRVWQEVSEYRLLSQPVVQILVLDDRPTTRIQEYPLFTGADEQLEQSLSVLATGYGLESAMVADLPREVALVIVLPAHGRIVGAPQVPALHVRSPSFDRVEARRMADALRMLVREAVAQPIRDDSAYSPVEAALDARALLLGARIARNDGERRIQADVAAQVRGQLRYGSKTVLLTDDFPGVVQAIGGPDSPTTFMLRPCSESVSCLSVTAGLPFFDGAQHLWESVPVSRQALDAEGRSRCMVEVRGYELGCEGRGWRRLPGTPGRSIEHCEVPELEGDAARACRERVRCETCSPGFCGRVERWSSLGFTKNAFPNQIDATLRVTCDLLR